jgi:putative PIN family toxin of toxin-antitoxin system
MAMTYKVFLDINIVVDFYVESRKNHLVAKKIFSLAEGNKIKAYLSESVINTTAYVLRKDYPIPKLKQVFEEMLDIFVVLGSNNNLFKEAYKNNVSDMEDALLYQLAVANRMDYFISNDEIHFKNINKKELIVISSPDFIKLFL